MDGPTYSDLFAIGRNEALARNSKLTLEKANQEGTDLNAMISAGAAVGDEVVGQLSRAQAKTFLDSSEGKDLDFYVFDKYNMVRKSASPAVGSVEFSTTDAVAASFSIPINTILSTSDGRQFTTTASATFSIGTTGPVTVAVRSVLAGLSQQAATNTITSIITPVTGSPADFVVTNSLATSGATDDEDDPSLRNRARLFWETARRGTLSAIEAGALAVPGVTTATAFENLDGLGRPAKSVSLVVADTFTDQLVNYGATPEYQTQSQVLTSTISTYLYDVRAGGINVSITIAQVVMQGIVLALTFKAGVDYETVALRARAIIVQSVNSLSPGAAMRRSALIDVLRSIVGLEVTGDEIYSPSGDIIALPLQVIRTSLTIVVPIGLQPVGALQSSLNPDTV